MGNIIELNEGSKTILAKLLARENISVVFGNFSTASFSPSDRILQLPTWQCPPNVHSLFIGHEVGHALFTPPDAIDIFNERYPNVPLSAMNILEDIRIERLILEEYPGLLLDFVNGYAHLYKEGFFCNGKPYEKISVADKLNVYAKVNRAIPLILPKKAADLYALAYAAETYEDVLDLIPAFVKLVNKSKGDDSTFPSALTFEVNGQPPPKSDFSFDDVADDDESEEDDNEVTNDDKLEIDPDAIESDSSFSNAVQSKCVDVSKYIVLAPTHDEVFKNIRWLKDDYYPFGVLHPEVAFNQIGDKKIVDLYVKNFLCQRAATSYSKAKIDRTGRIDVNRVHAYKYDDNIFKSVMVMHDSTSHGMVMLIDFSVSMVNILEHVIAETINLCNFCRKVSIPFKVFTFTCDGGSNKYTGAITAQLNPLSIKMNEVLNSDLPEPQYKKSVQYLHAVGRNVTVGGDTKRYMSGTPLNHAILNINRVATHLKKQWNIQKMNVVILSDGADTGMIVSKGKNDDAILDRKNTNVKSYIKYDRFLVEMNNRNTYSGVISLLKKTTDAKVFGFYITDTKGAASFIDGGSSMSRPNVIRQISSPNHPFNSKNSFMVEDVYSYDGMVILNKLSYTSLTSLVDELPNLDGFDANGAARVFKSCRQRYIRSSSFVGAFVKVLA